LVKPFKPNRRYDAGRSPQIPEPARYRMVKSAAEETGMRFISRKRLPKKGSSWRRSQPSAPAREP
jgi:hypothetical protein